MCATNCEGNNCIELFNRVFGTKYLNLRHRERYSKHMRSPTVLKPELNSHLKLGRYYLVCMGDVECYLQTRQPQNDKTLGYNGHHEDVVDRLMDRAHGRNVFGPLGCVRAATVGRWCGCWCCCCCGGWLRLDAVDRLTVYGVRLFCVCLCLLCSQRRGTENNRARTQVNWDEADTAKRVSEMEASTRIWI